MNNTIKRLPDNIVDVVGQHIDYTREDAAKAAKLMEKARTQMVLRMPWFGYLAIGSDQIVAGSGTSAISQWICGKFCPRNAQNTIHFAIQSGKSKLICTLAWNGSKDLFLQVSPAVRKLNQLITTPSPRSGVRSQPVTPGTTGKASRLTPFDIPTKAQG